MKKGFFSQKVVGWYLEHQRDLPWRKATDPYPIWLSEIILQQTRVVQGLSYYKHFIERYPNIKILAQAKLQDVLRSWQGLGYYSRARNLHNCAKQVVDSFDCRFPESFSELKRLPGIGDYTAAAIASIAFQEPVGVVDGNVYRVLSRLFGIDKDIASTEGKKFFQDFAQTLVPEKNPGQYNQAVMEFGALYCIPRNPNCTECIFRTSCYAFQHNEQSTLPVKLKKTKIRKRHFNYFVIRQGNKFLMRERQDDIWKGLFDFPILEEEKLTTSPSVLLRKLVRPAKISTHQLMVKHVSGVYRHVLTHQVIFARFIEVDLNKEVTLGLPRARWYSAKQIATLPKPRLIVRFFVENNIL